MAQYKLPSKVLSQSAVYVIVCCWVIVSGCAGSRETTQVKQEVFEDRVPVVQLATEQIHSPSGDMTARLPRQWVTLDPGALEMPQAFTVACNPDYTVAVIFSEIPLDNAMRDGYGRNGMKGLLQVSFDQRKKQLGEQVQLVGQMEEFAIGQRRFGAYTYTTDSSFTTTRVAMFYTDFHLYESAITHLTFHQFELPSPETLREIQQIILSSVEW